MSKHTQRTIKALGEQGCMTGMVERFIAQAGKAIPVNGNPHLRKRTGIRKDLFGIIDLIALRPPNTKIYNPIDKGFWTTTSWELVGVQSFGQDFADHKRKVLANKAAPIWLATGAVIELWGWRKLKVKRGGKAEVWKPRVYRVQRGDFESIPSTPSGKTEIFHTSTPRGSAGFFEKLYTESLENKKNQTHTSETASWSNDKAMSATEALGNYEKGLERIQEGLDVYDAQILIDSL